jgi:hypothetical protein
MTWRNSENISTRGSGARELSLFAPAAEVAVKMEGRGPGEGRPVIRVARVRSRLPAGGSRIRTPGPTLVLRRANRVSAAGSRWARVTGLLVKGIADEASRPRHRRVRSSARPLLRRSAGVEGAARIAPRYGCYGATAPTIQSVHKSILSAHALRSQLPFKASHPGGHAPADNIRTNRRVSAGPMSAGQAIRKTSMPPFSA